MKLVALVKDPDSVRRFLSSVGLDGAHRGVPASRRHARRGAPRGGSIWLISLRSG